MTKPWGIERLDQVAQVVGRGIAPKYDDDGDFLVVNQRCIRDGRVSLDIARRHNSGARKVKADKVLSAGDVLVNSTGVGTLGRTAPLRDVHSSITADSHVTILRPLPDVSSRWFAYAVSALEPEIENLAEGSTGQTELSRHRLAHLELTVPPLSEQHAIAATLGALDDKIESNRRQRHLLRELGLAEYQSSVRDDRKSLQLSAATVSIARGVAPKYADEDLDAALVINQKCIRDGWVSLAPARRMFDRSVKTEKRASSGDILVNSTGTGTLGRVARWHAGDIYVDGHVSVVKADHSVTSPTVLAYSLLGREADIEGLATGSTGQTELSAARLGELRVILPPTDQGSKLETTLITIEDRCDQLAAENTHLESTRDVLLPELLSGRIRVPVEGVEA